MIAGKYLNNTHLNPIYCLCRGKQNVIIHLSAIFVVDPSSRVGFVYKKAGWHASKIKIEKFY